MELNRVNTVMLIFDLQHPEHLHDRCFLILQLQTQHLCLPSKVAALLLAP